MTFIGLISVADKPVGVALEAWTHLIAAHPNLERVPSRDGVNPFTREPMTFKGHPGDANVLIDGTIVGSMVWAPDDSNCIVVSGDPALVSAIAADVAAKLGTVFVPMAQRT